MSKFDITAHATYDDEPACRICHMMDCECPECDVCGEAGNPACINTHMPWEKWGHFTFAPTKADKEYAEKQMDADIKFYEELNKDYKPPTEEELHKYHESFDENNQPPR